jgi:UDP-N-acetylmuramyl pentapeptide phosphotransferase/UDP-N-acetylglucosamine-1-phosphate transferase
MKVTVFCDVAPCSLGQTHRRFRDAYFIALILKSVSTSETSVNFYETTRRNIPEDTHLYILGHESLKAHPVVLLFVIITAILHTHLLSTSVSTK